MKIKCLPRSLYRLYNYASKQTAISDQIEQRKKFLGDWEILKARKVSEKEIAKITGISRATYYRLKKSISIHGIRGLEKQSRCPKVFRKSKIPRATIDIALDIRRKNPTYGKLKAL